MHLFTHLLCIGCLACGTLQTQERASERSEAIYAAEAGVNLSAFFPEGNRVPVIYPFARYEYYNSQERGGQCDPLRGAGTLDVSMFNGVQQQTFPPPVQRQGKLLVAPSSPDESFLLDVLTQPDAVSPRSCRYSLRQTR